MNVPESIQKTGLFYYVSIKDFEKDPDRKKLKVVKMEQAVRDQIIENLETTPHMLLFDCFYKENKNNTVIDNYGELLGVFSKCDLRSLFFENIALDAGMPCKFIEGNNAWISRSNSGHFRYFTKDQEGKLMAFDLLDIASLYYRTTLTETAFILAKNLKIRFMEEVWFNQQNKKYIANMSMIHGSKKYIEENYPCLGIALKPHLKILETLNVLGNINIKKQEYGYKQNNIFFCSSKYLSEFLGEGHYSKINKVINYLCVLGLVIKVPLNEVPYNLLYESKEIAKQRNLGNIINYFVVPAMSDVLDKSEVRACQLQKYGITYSNISSQRVAVALGEETVGSIYVQEIQKNKKSHKVGVSEIYNKSLQVIDKVILEYGYCTKCMVIDRLKIRLTKKEKLREIDKVWKTLLVENSYKYCKPTENQKKEFGLKTNQYIVIKNI